ncbi:endolytic transglycosylase MltG [Desulfitobacterium sp.]|uniref:endolytic transglycosylase MltG n=1 Tax=Desulfitobacterium sp. TaxID=49981 RepID=UPI002C1651A0|nr:endolytic transglycosylase MltG [Desulfitobacterium sp.]HVJ48342.1 endolytic transglycosylase MltG [Desulfitobacterium sp.]
MKISRQYLLGLGSGLILSAMLALLFNPATAKSPSTAGATAAAASSPVETLSTATASPSSQTPASSAQESQSSEKSAPENNTTQAKKSVVIPPGASADKIAQLLQNEGWIQNKEDFLAIAKTRKLENRFKAGTYELVPGLSIDDIINQLIK